MLAVVLVGFAGSAHAGPGIPCTPAAAARAAAALRALGPLERVGPPPDSSQFVLFGWVSPPAESTTQARIDEMAGLGFNLLIPAWLDQGCPDDNLARLDDAAARGMRCVVWDSRLMGAVHWLPTFEDTLDEVVAAYRDHPGLWGYYLGDEPPSEIWPLLGRLRAELRMRDPTHYAWDDLLGRASFDSQDDYVGQLRGYASAFRPVALSSDEYDFLHGADRGLFVENLAGLRAVADEAGVPFWNVIQLVPHLDYRPLAPGELRWEVAQSLAWGTHGIGYFTYWTPDPDPNLNWQPAIIDHDGHRTAWYDFLAGFDVGVRAAGDLVAHARWRGTSYSGFVPRGGRAFVPGPFVAAAAGPAVLGEFLGADGRTLLVVGNGDSLAARTVTLECHATGATLLAGGSAPQVTVTPIAAGVRVELALAAGDFAVVALDPPPGRATLRIAPNPARARVQLVLRVPAEGARVEILDAGGRRVWSAVAPGAAAALEWRGERNDGRVARPGIYVARVTSGGSVVTRRFAWLGAP